MKKGVMYRVGGFRDTTHLLVNGAATGATIAHVMVAIMAVLWQQWAVFAFVAPMAIGWAVAAFLTRAKHCPGCQCYPHLSGICRACGHV